MDFVRHSPTWMVAFVAYYLGKNQKSTSVAYATPTPYVTQIVSPTAAPTSPQVASFAPKNTTGWKTYTDISYSFMYPPAWNVTTSIVPNTNKEQVKINIPSNQDILAYFGPNPHANPGGGGGPEVPTFVDNTISFAYQGNQQTLSEEISFLGSEKTFSQAILDQIQLDSVKDLDASFITYHPSMSVTEYYDLRNTFLTILQTLTIK